ncbi:MAG: bifunctional folylpolyglutamate synthase/dihydrofolate synthase [Bacteroidia bacterium]|nr:bifunctional folylpolyglutamate synthase/dihydrofolate synthase [Bacteroidia bacterium]
MTYLETLNYLFSQLPMYQRVGVAAYKSDLKNTVYLDRLLNYPHRKFRSIHVAGTNGKGSVSHFLAAILQSAGYKTGLYTSPHLTDFRERIKINGIKISEDYIIKFVEDNIYEFKQINPSFFEMTVALSFDYFANNKVDVAVIETGLGGRLDSTNIITPVLSVITNIGLDHTDLLGDSIDKIAFEKAGIIKPEVPVVIGESQPGADEVFIRKTKEVNADIYFAGQSFSFKEKIATPEALSLDILKDGLLIYPELQSGLAGIYQKKNILTVLQAVHLLMESGFRIEDKSVYEGIAHVVEMTGLFGRWQILGNQPLTVCDTGHNEAGIRLVIQQIETLKYKKLHIIIGFVNDKNVDKIFELLPQNAEYYFTRANIPRAMDEKILEQKAAAYHLKGKSYPGISGAYQAAKIAADKDDFIFIGGSTFVVAEVL